MHLPHATAIGVDPFATLERLPGGDILVTVIAHTPKHVNLKMVRYRPDLSAGEVVLYVSMPKGERP